MDFTVKTLCRRGYEAEKTSAIQSRKIEELESQLTEAEEIVVNLRAQKQRALEEFEKINDAAWQWNKQNKHESSPIDTSDSQHTEALRCSSIKEMNMNGTLNRLPCQDNEMPLTTPESSVLIGNLVLDELKLQSTSPRCISTEHRCHSTQKISEIEDNSFDGHGNIGFIGNELNATSSTEEPSAVLSAMEKYNNNGVTDGNEQLSVHTVAVNCDIDRRNINRTVYHFFTRKRRNNSQRRILHKWNTSDQLVADHHHNEPCSQILPSQCADVAVSDGYISASVLEDYIDEFVPNSHQISTRSKEPDIEFKERMRVFAGENHHANMDEAKFPGLLSCRPTIVSQTERNGSSSCPSNMASHKRTVGSDYTIEETVLDQSGDTYSCVREVGTLPAETVTLPSVLESSEQCSEIANDLHDVAVMEERVTLFEASLQNSHRNEIACESLLAPTNNKVRKYMLQRKRKKDVLDNTAGNIVEENMALSCIIKDKMRGCKSRLRTTYGMVNPSRYSKRLVRISRQVKTLCRRGYEAEKTSAIQSRKIEELESQLTEAEEIVVNLRAQKQRALEEFEKINDAAWQWNKQNKHESSPIDTSDSQHTEALRCSSIKEMNMNGTLNRLPCQDNEMPLTTPESSVLIGNLVLDELKLQSTSPRCISTEHRCHSTQKISEIEDNSFDGHGNIGFIGNELNATSSTEEPSAVLSAMEKYNNNGVTDGNEQLSVHTVAVNCDIDRRNINRTVYHFFTRKRRNNSQRRILHKWNTSDQLVADHHHNEPCSQILPSQCADVAVSDGYISASVLEDYIDEFVPNSHQISTRSKEPDIEFKERMRVFAGENHHANMDEAKFPGLLSCRPTIVSQTERNGSSSCPSNMASHKRTVGSDYTIEETVLDQSGDTYSCVREVGTLPAETVTLPSVLESSEQCSEIANDLHDVAVMEERVTLFEASLQNSHRNEIACESLLAPTNNKVRKYMLQRKRKKDVLDNTAGNIVEENMALSCIIKDKMRGCKSRLRTTYGMVNPSRYSKRLVRISRQVKTLCRRGYEAEKTSAIQSRKIEELESQLTEAEEIVVNLRAQKQRALEEFEKINDAAWQWNKQNKHESSPIDTSDSQHTEALRCSSIKEMNMNGTLNRLPCQDNEMPLTTPESSVLIGNLVLDELKLQSTSPRCISTEHRCHSTQKISEIEDNSFDGHGNIGFIGNELNATSSTEEPSAVLSAMEKYNNNGVTDGNEQLSVHTVAVNCDIDRRNINRTVYHFFTRKRRNNSQRRILHKWNTSDQLVADHHHNEPCSQILPSQCADVAVSDGYISASVLEDYIDEFVPNSHQISTRSKEPDIEFKERMRVFAGENHHANMDEAKFPGLLSCRPTIVSQTERNGSSSCPSNMASHKRTVGSDYTIEETVLDQSGDTYSCVREVGTLPAETVTLPSVLESSEQCSEIANDLHDVAVMEERVTLFEASLQNSHRNEIACESLLAPTNNKVRKYMLQRKRKKDVLDNTAGNIVEENMALSCIIKDKMRGCKSRLRTTYGMVNPSRYSKRLVRISRQHIALSRRRLL